MKWKAIARRIVDCVAPSAGELIQVRDCVGRIEVLHAVLAEIDVRGATPQIDFQPPGFIEEWLPAITPVAMTEYGRHRMRWMHEIDKIIVLGGDFPDLSSVDPAVLAQWQAMDDHLTQVEEQRQLPMVVCAIPNERRATRLGMALRELEDHLLPAFAVGIAEGQEQIARVLRRAEGKHITIRTVDPKTNAVHELCMQHGNRPWHVDDGFIDQADRDSKSIVSNLPCMSIYRTVVEESATGSIYLAAVRLSPQTVADEVLFIFEDGRISKIEAMHGAEAVTAWMNSFSGDARRISHIGIGLNPKLQKAIGWTLVDEHVEGALFLALGENRYMGGNNVSSLNHDFALLGASLVVDDRFVVEKGHLVLH